MPATRKARLLLAYLLLNHNHPIPRDRLLGLFWPERPEALARRALSNALWHIRRSLGPAANRLVTQEDDVAFVLQPGDWLDADEFRSLYAEINSPTNQHLPLSTEKLSKLQRAAALYRADLLEGYYEDWVLFERERLREFYLQILAQLITVHKQRGEYNQALTYALRLVAADPLREEAHRELMRLYHLLGRPRAALNQYETLRRLLQDELRAEPTPSTTALYNEIAAALEEAAPPHLPIRPSPPPILGNLAHLPFIGRRNERLALLDALQAAANGHGTFVLVEGEAGVGKSRLVAELAADARWRGFLVGVGRATSLTLSTPYHLLAKAFDELLTPLRISQLARLTEPYHISAIAPLFPAISSVLPDLPPLPALPLEQQGERLWEGLGHCLAGLATIAPLLLILEDLHRADEATLTALRHIAPHLHGSRLLLVITARGSEAREQPMVWGTLEALDRAAPLRRIHLQPFDVAQTITLVQRALGVADQEVDFARRLWAETRGNPLFLIETLKALLEEGSLSPLGDGRWRFPAPDTPWPSVTSLQNLVAERLERLSPAERAVLELVAVLGGQADFRLLTHILDVEPKALPALLHRLSRKGFLVEREDHYAFEHDRIQEIIYRRITPARQRQLHRRAGQALEKLHPEQVEALARHFERGGVPEKALAYFLKAGEYAQALYATEAALACYERALNLVRDDDPATRWEILNHQVQVLNILGKRDRQAATLDEMERLAETLGDETRKAQTLYSRGWLEVLAGDPRQALALLDEAAALARLAGERALLGNCLVAAARAHWRIGDVRSCQAAAEEAQSLFREIGDQDGESRVLNMVGNLHLGLTGDYGQALACFEENQRLAHRRGDRYREAVSRLNAGVVRTILGDYHGALGALDEAWEFMVHTGNRNLQGIIQLWRGACYRGLGDVNRAQEAAERALAICREVGDRNFELEALELLGFIAADLGAYAEAREHFAQALEVAQDNGQLRDAILARSHLALASLRLGEVEEAHRLSAQAVSELKELGEPPSQMQIVYFERHQIVAEAEGLAPARPYLEYAYRLLMEAADRIRNPQLRHSFLENVPEHRAILIAHRLGHPPTPLRRQTVRLPHIEAPLGRPLREDEWVEVTWTLALPEDDEIPGKVARRQHRLLRLLGEAAEQGAAPTIEHLAAALEVSQATVKRDLAALRRAGHKVHTRGRS